MGHKPGILPCVALGIVVLTMVSGEGVERFTELAVGTDAAHEGGFGIEILAVAHGAVAEIFRIGFLCFWQL